jgi:hypothetical protein
VKASPIEVLETRIAQLTARKVAAQKRELRSTSKLQNRRKFLLGAYVLGTVGGDTNRLDREFLAGLDRWATRRGDREALGLPLAPGEGRHVA